MEQEAGAQELLTWIKMAAQGTQERDVLPPFRDEITDLSFINISIKCYEKKIGSGFKEEYYAFKILSM